MELELPTHSRLRDYFEVGSQNTASIVPRKRRACQEQFNPSWNDSSWSRLTLYDSISAHRTGTPIHFIFKKLGEVSILYFCVFCKYWNMCNEPNLLLKRQRTCRKTYIIMYTFQWNLIICKLGSRCDLAWNVNKVSLQSNPPDLHGQYITAVLGLCPQNPGCLLQQRKITHDRIGSFWRRCQIGQK